MSADKKLAALLKLSKKSELKEEKERDNESKADRTMRYLEYKINYGKHKGKAWKELYANDYGYFTWALSRLSEFNPESKTVAALSHLLRTKK